jgi:hypothetical protein
MDTLPELVMVMMTIGDKEALLKFDWSNPKLSPHTFIQGRILFTITRFFDMIVYRFNFCPNLFGFCCFFYKIYKLISIQIVGISLHVTFIQVKKYNVNPNN